MENGWDAVNGSPVCRGALRVVYVKLVFNFVPHVVLLEGACVPHKKGRLEVGHQPRARHAFQPVEPVCVGASGWRR